MTTDIRQWLEHEISGFSFNGVAKRTGLTMSTVRRHLIEDPKTGSAPETLVRICRAYNLNPVEALIEAGFIERYEVQLFVEEAVIRANLQDAPVGKIFKRVREELTELEYRFGSQTHHLGDGNAAEPDPDYSELSAQDVKDYGLAAKSEDEHIAPDELPNQP